MLLLFGEKMKKVTGLRYAGALRHHPVNQYPAAPFPGVRINP